MRIQNSLIPIIFILLTSYIAYLSPMQSDDFSYFMMGLDLQSHIQHYNTWSGRLLADYISPILLMMPHKIIASSLIAIAATSMIYIISRLPALLLNQTYSIKNFYILFIIYWLSNPTLGQTIFWIVGAANYLFTNLIIVLYLLCFILYYKNTQCIFRFAALIICSALVGFSSENTTWLVLLFSIASSYYLAFQKNDKKIIISLLLVSLSFYFMIFSPGNMVRANSEAFAEFYSQSFIERIVHFVIQRVPTAITRMLPIILPMIVLIWIAIKNGLPKKLQYTFYGLCLIALLSLGSMVMSPTLTYRSLSGPILFLLLASSIPLQFIFSQDLYKFKVVSSLLWIVLSLFFIISYTLITYSYQRLHLQEKLVLQTITRFKSNSHSNILLPDFHYVPSLRARDSHDQYVNPGAMAQYYQIANIKLNPMRFDYSVLFDLPNSLPISNHQIFNDLYITPYGLFGRHGSNIILTSPHPMNQSVDLIFEITNNQKQIERIYLPMQSTFLAQKNVIGFQSQFKNNTITEIRYAIASNNFKDNQDSFTILYQK